MDSIYRKMQEIIQKNAGPLETGAALRKLFGIKLPDHSAPNQNTEESLSSTGVCKHRGKLLQEGSCSCGDGNIWKCAILSRQIGKACGEGKCRKYESKLQAVL